MLTPRQIAEQGTFLVNEVGSSVHGTNLEDMDDLDLMGVCFQPDTYLLGLNRFEEFRYRTAEERAKFDSDEDQRRSGRQPRSQPGDTDLVIYSAQKYLRLALDGNPSILVFLFSPMRHHEFEINTNLLWGESFSRLRDIIASRLAGIKFYGYLESQKRRLLGLQGQMRVTRTELIDQFGFDTKYAMQTCRLGIQGIEYMDTGRLQLPMPQHHAEKLKSVRIGAMGFAEVIDWINELEETLKNAIDNSILPKHPDREIVNRWLAQTQLEFFEWQRQSRGSGYEARLP